MVINHKASLLPGHNEWNARVFYFWRARILSINSRLPRTMATQQAEATTTADSRVDWRHEYEETLAAVRAGDCGRGDGSGSTEAEGTPLVMAAPVERFLDRILLAASEQSTGEKASPIAEASDVTVASESVALRKRLAAIGQTLRPLLSKQETVMAAAARAKAQPQPSGTKSTRVGLLQLELVVRVIGYGGVKGKSAKKKARGEIRGLLDRIALLLDAANPASITGDDGRSPFQELLEGVLASRLEKPLPQLVRFLLKAYEFLEEEQEGVDARANEALPGLGASATRPGVQSSQEVRLCIGGTLLRHCL